MNIMKDITINISPDDIAQLIVDYLLKEGYVATVKDVTFLSGSRLEGFYETPVNYFDGCKVHIKDVKR